MAVCEFSQPGSGHYGMAGLVSLSDPGHCVLEA